MSKNGVREHHGSVPFRGRFKKFSPRWKERLHAPPRVLITASLIPKNARVVELADTYV